MPKSGVQIQKSELNENHTQLQSENKQSYLSQMTQNKYKKAGKLQGMYQRKGQTRQKIHQKITKKQGLSKPKAEMCSKVIGVKQTSRNYQSLRKFTKATNVNRLPEQVETKISAFFRYYPIIIINACGEKDKLLHSLASEGQIKVYSPCTKKVQANTLQAWQKLLKIAQLKGKYKYRQKFNFSHSAQLKAIDFKIKEVKKKRQQLSSSSQEEVDRRQKCRDIQTWKKTMGVSNRKVFVIKGGYYDLKHALLQRGWVENKDKYSNLYDLKWTCKSSDVDYKLLKPGQIVNHFDNNVCLISKYGICKSLRSIMYNSDIDIDKFFPKAYDLTDLSDFENFIQVFKWVSCESELKRYIAQQQKSVQDDDGQPFIDKEEQELRIKICLTVTKRRVIGTEKALKIMSDGEYNLCSINQWKFISKEGKYSKKKLKNSIKQWGYEELKGEQLRRQCIFLLQKVKQLQPQYELNGNRNIWIVKPAFLSRGRGIKCYNQLNGILSYALGKETQFVVQKYIENPLIIKKKKFDIRVWVIIEDYNPPKIWIYKQFYVRFCLEDYDPSVLSNRYSHLTNNSVQKHSKKFTNLDKQKSMWSQQQFQKFITLNFGDGKFKPILSKMRQIIIATIVSTQSQVNSRKNTFQLVGYDFMIDQLLSPWLIQINSSPAMDYSTPVTSRLVKMVMEDTAKVMIDNKYGKKKQMGLFKCVYEGQSFVGKKYKIDHKI